MAYEVDTHARLTEQAYILSVLNPDNVLSPYADFGLINIGTSNPLGKAYLDFNDQGDIIARYNHKYERELMPYGINEE
ncbi:MAG: hypothetical protein GWN00_16385, partial [Aliifodinibius sp.]|nr:hypothetical protein [Fodinibius sp.]NIU14476.1 hypothetical protein [candidate division Zixibacteria bacterium]NIX56607.1 hypothetical protein [candidate division Zixibacteria bacterium]NIY26324.1 hypothetical protein [Fodinibius sp.]